jgi:hypothetical protein
MAAPTRPPTQLISMALIDELNTVLARLRCARQVGDKDTAAKAEARLNVLIECLPRNLS